MRASDPLGLCNFHSIRIVIASLHVCRPRTPATTYASRSTKWVPAVQQRQLRFLCRAKCLPGAKRPSSRYSSGPSCNWIPDWKRINAERGKLLKGRDDARHHGAYQKPKARCALSSVGSAINSTLWLRENPIGCLPRNVHAMQFVDMPDIAQTMPSNFVRRPIRLPPSGGYSFFCVIGDVGR